METALIVLIVGVLCGGLGAVAGWQGRSAKGSRAELEAFRLLAMQDARAHQQHQDRVEEINDAPPATGDDLEELLNKPIAVTPLPPHHPPP